MRQLFRRQQTPLAILLSTVLFTGCFSQTNYTTGDQSHPSARQYATFSAADSASDALPMEEVESSSELRQELDLLSQSGTWQTAPEGSDETQQQTRYDFPIVRNKQVEAYIQLFTGKQRRSFSRFLSRSGRYIEMIEQEFANSGLPKDLAYLALVESGFNPRARSHASAVGMWQFMRGTGKDYNLKINSYVDERCNVEKSTNAAANYLGDLYRDFGDWYLAVAAYNAGQGTIRKGMQKHKVDNFWDLAAKNHLRLETIRYVPKLLATIIIARNPEKFGFSDIQFEKPLQYDTLTVGPSLGLQAIALVTGSDKKEIRQLNPELQRNTTPAHLARYDIKIPKGTKNLAQNNMDRLHRVATTAYKTHKVGKKDTLAGICRKYNINATTLLKVNNLPSGKLARGKSLRIPYNTIAYRLLPAGTEKAILANKEDLILHTIQKGDTLGAIARRYHVPMQLIMSWNGLQSARKIRAGQQLALFIDKSGQNIFGASTPTTRRIVATRTKSMQPLNAGQESTASLPVITAANKKIHRIPANSHPNKSSEMHYYSVQSGDSLWKISRKFHISMAEIKKWNSLKTNRLQPGKTLKIKKS